MPSIWAAFSLTEGLDLPEPGARRFTVDVDPGDTFIWPFYWCASDEDTLAENLRFLTVHFFVDDFPVAPAAILQFDQASSDWDCRLWTTMISGWQAGTEVSLTIRYSFSQDVDDGIREYPAGDYSFELEADVGG